MKRLYLEKIALQCRIFFSLDTGTEAQSYTYGRTLCHAYSNATSKAFLLTLALESKMNRAGEGNGKNPINTHRGSSKDNTRGPQPRRPLLSTRNTSRMSILIVKEVKRAISACHIDNSCVRLAHYLGRVQERSHLSWPAQHTPEQTNLTSSPGCLPKTGR